MDPYKNLHGSHDCILGGGVDMSWYTPNPEDPQNKHFHQLEDPKKTRCVQVAKKNLPREFSKKNMKIYEKPTLLELARKYRPWTFLGGGFQDFLEKTPELATLLPFKLRINNII